MIPLWTMCTPQISRAIAPARSMRVRVASILAPPCPRAICSSQGAAGDRPTLATAHKVRHENVNVRHGSIGFVPAVPRRLQSPKALRDTYCSPAEEFGGTDIVVKPVADHYRVRCCTAGARESQIENHPIRFFDVLFRGGGKGERDEHARRLCSTPSYGTSKSFGYRDSARISLWRFGSFDSFSITLVIKRGANSLDACWKADRTSSTEQRPPYRSKELTNCWMRASVAASSLMSVLPRSKKSQRLCRIPRLYQLYPWAAGTLRFIACRMELAASPLERELRLTIQRA